MEVRIKNFPKCRAELKVEVPAEEFKNFFEKAILELSKDMEVKGFRKGKVPRDIVEKEIGQEKILVEAAELAIEDNYRKAILENKVEAISRPEIEIQKLAPGNPFIFLAKVSVLPEIKLSDYKKIAAEIKKKEINPPAGGEEKEVEDALKWLQKSRAKFTLKNQAAQKGDFVEIEYRSPQLNELGRQDNKKDAFILGEGHFLPGFEENLIGMKAGEEKENIAITIPETYSVKNLAGKKIILKVKVKSVQNVEFPQVNDQFAKSLGKFEKLEDLKKNIKEGLISEKEQAESRRLREEILEKLSEKTESDLPDVLVKREQKQMLENLKKNVSEHLKVSFSDYLEKLKKSEKEILDSFLPRAEKNIKKLLILKEIGKREKIEVSGDEVSKEIEKILKQYANPEEARKSGLDPEGLEDYTKEAIKNEKIFQFLESFIK